MENLLGLDGTNCCADTHDLALRKLALIQEKMAALAAIQSALTGLVHQCEIGNSESGCPIIQSLTHPGL